MEIVAIYTDEFSRLFLNMSCSVIASILLLVAVHFLKFQEWFEGLGTLVIALALLISPWMVPHTTYYDAIITDWNFVHEEGFTVVGSKNDIMTLVKERK